MTLRLTALSNFLLFRQSLADRNVEIFKYSEQLSSQKRINRPSDDPVGAKAVLFARETQNKITEYQRNLDLAKAYLLNSESTLDQAKEMMARAKELAIQARSDNMSAEQRQQVAKEVNQLLLQLRDLGNTQVNGEYIFSGYSTTTAPFTLDPTVDDTATPNVVPVATYNGATSFKAMQISDSSQLTFQVSGERAFMGSQGGVAVAGMVNCFDVLSGFENALNANDSSDTTGIGYYIDEIETGFRQMVNEIASIGAKTNRVETAQAHFVSQKDTLTEFISLTEDVDVSEVAFNYQRASLALQATIQSAGSVLNLPSLLDFVGK